MHETPQTIDLDYGITAVDTHYVRPLMDASHLIVDAGRAAFVDTGSSHSVPHLLAALRAKGLSEDAVDYVLITHVHLDHAGGAGTLMRRLPNATAVLHPRAAPHMIAPDKLIAGTRAVYGDELYAELYGEILPIDEARVRVVEDGDTLTLGQRTLTFLHTAGHALHHYSIVDGSHGGVFSGDSFGVSYRETDTGKGPFIFPTTTPTQFDPAAAHDSYDRIAGYATEAVYLTHYSRVTNAPALAADLHRRLDAFVDIARRHVDTEPRAPAIATALREYIDAELDAHGYDGDAEARAVVVDADMQLNAQGLDVWLHRLRKNGEI